MKVGYDPGGSLMKDEVVGGKAFREVQNPGLGGLNVGYGFDPDSVAERIPSQDVIRRSLHMHPCEEVRLAKEEKAVNQVNTCIDRCCCYIGSVTLT